MKVIAFSILITYESCDPLAPLRLIPNEAQLRPEHMLTRVTTPTALLERSPSIS